MAPSQSKPPGHSQPPGKSPTLEQKGRAHDGDTSGHVSERGDHPGRRLRAPRPPQRITGPSVQKSPSARKFPSPPAGATKALSWQDRPVSSSGPVPPCSTPSADGVAHGVAHGEDSATQGRPEGSEHRRWDHSAPWSPDPVGRFPVGGPGFPRPPSRNTQKRAVSVCRPGVPNQGAGRAGSCWGPRRSLSRAPPPTSGGLLTIFGAPPPISAPTFTRCLPACPPAWVQAPFLTGTSVTGPRPPPPREDPILTTHICGDPNSK